MLLLLKWHEVAIGIILVVVGVVRQRVGNAIRLSAVCHPLIMVGRLDGFVVVRVCGRRGIVLMIRVVLVVRWVWRGVV